MALTPTEQTQLETLRLTDSFTDETLRVCDRILASRQLGRVRDKAKALLRFVVGKKLLGREQDIKEMTIAIHVFGQSGSFDTTTNSRVRVAAKSLRQKLCQYNATEGQNDAVQITIPSGHYIPDILDQRISIAFRLENWNLNRSDEHLRLAVSDELERRLAEAGATEVKQVRALGKARHWLRYALRSTFECQDERVTLRVLLSDVSAGGNVSGKTFTTSRAKIFTFPGRVARAVIATLRAKNRAAPEPKAIVREKTRATRPRTLDPKRSKA